MKPNNQSNNVFLPSIPHLSLDTNNLKEYLTRINPDNIFKFLKETHLFTKIWKKKTKTFVLLT